jgi:hypothetical protein
MNALCTLRGGEAACEQGGVSACSSSTRSGASGARRRWFRSCSRARARTRPGGRTGDKDARVALASRCRRPPNLPAHCYWFCGAEGYAWNRPMPRVTTHTAGLRRGPPPQLPREPGQPLPSSRTFGAGTMSWRSESQRAGGWPSRSTNWPWRSNPGRGHGFSVPCLVPTQHCPTKSVVASSIAWRRPAAGRSHTARG